MQHTFKEIDEESNRIVFRTIDSSKTIMPHQLSAGEKQLLIILLTVLVQDEKPAILLLDEPEISLQMETIIEAILKRVQTAISELNKKVRQKKIETLSDELTQR